MSPNTSNTEPDLKIPHDIQFHPKVIYSYSLYELQQRPQTSDSCQGAAVCFLMFSSEELRKNWGVGHQILAAGHMQLWHGDISAGSVCLREKTTGSIVTGGEVHVTLNIHTRIRTHTHIPSRSNRGIVVRDVILSRILLAWSKRHTHTGNLSDFGTWKVLPSCSPPSLSFPSLNLPLGGCTKRQKKTSRPTCKQTHRYLVDWQTSEPPRLLDPHRPGGWRRRW